MYSYPDGCCFGAADFVDEQRLPRTFRVQTTVRRRFCSGRTDQLSTLAQLGLQQIINGQMHILGKQSNLRKIPRPRTGFVIEIRNDATAPGDRPWPWNPSGDRSGIDGA